MPEIDILSVDRGSIAAPAGCGKTQLIADAVSTSKADKPILILTHTNAGRSALEARLNKLRIARQRYRVATIDSWSMRLVYSFPARSQCNDAARDMDQPNLAYPAIRKAALRLVSGAHIGEPLKASYSRVVVDEYQDCTLPQHRLVDALAETLPTVVLGDPLQAIFDFKEPTVDWNADVLGRFPECGELSTPWRWRNAKCERLGDWLLRCRRLLLRREPIDLRDAPKEVEWHALPADEEEAHRLRLQAARTSVPVRDARVLIIGDSMDPPSHRQLACQTPGATVVEANEYKDLRRFSKRFNAGDAQDFPLLVECAADLMTGSWSKDLVERVRLINEGHIQAPSSSTEAAALAFVEAPCFKTARRFLEAAASADDARVFRPVAFALLCAALEVAGTEGCSFDAAMRNVRERNRHAGRSAGARAVGSTLLLKGLEAEAAVVLNPSVMNAPHLYVALTRGSHRLVICSKTPVLKPA